MFSMLCSNEKKKYMLSKNFLLYNLYNKVTEISKLNVHTEFFLAIFSERKNEEEKIHIKQII